MDNQKTLIFDFDGTLADTFGMSMQILQKILPKKYLDKLDFSKLDMYRNMSTKDLQKMLGLSMWRIPILIWEARKEMKKRLSEIKPFEDIPTMLETLKNSGIRMYVVSTNSEKIINSFLNTNKLISFFTKVSATRDIFGKSRVLANLIKTENLSLENTYYVGDEVRDIEACNSIGLKCISVSWGFNSKDILISKNSYKVVNSPMELANFVS